MPTQWTPAAIWTLIGVVGAALVLAYNHFAAARWLWRSVRSIGRGIKRGVLAVIDLFRHRARIEALEKQVAGRLVALEPAKGPKTIPHHNMRWALSQVSGEPVAHCDRCFQTGGHLFELRVGENPNKSSQLWCGCPSGQCSSILIDKDAFREAQVRVLPKLMA